MAKPCQRLFAAKPMPDLEVPGVPQSDLESALLVPLSS
jgi:hypothetical protein